MARRAGEHTTVEPRLLTRQAAADRCSLSLRSFDEWVRQGRLPRSIPGTHRWHLGALDAALDRLAGVETKIPASNPLDEWLASHGNH